MLEKHQSWESTICRFWYNTER